MKTLTKLPLLLLALLLPESAILSAEPIQLRVLSYNIHHGAGVDRKLDLERIAKVILSVKPDLVALQEVDRNVKRSRTVDQPAELGRLTIMNVAFGENIELQGGHYGNAILSRIPIERFKNHLLPNVDDGEQRGVLVADIDYPKLDSQIRLLSTHFDHRPNDRERVQSAEHINELVLKSKRPTLLMGDLNDVISSDTLNKLDEVWKRTNDKPMPTIPVNIPSRQIDFILYQPVEQWKVIETRVLDEDVASDHRAIFSVLELHPAQE